MAWSRPRASAARTSTVEWADSSGRTRTSGSTGAGRRGSRGPCAPAGPRRPGGRPGGVQVGPEALPAQGGRRLDGEALQGQAGAGRPDMGPQHRHPVQGQHPGGPGQRPGRSAAHTVTSPCPSPDRSTRCRTPPGPGGSTSSSSSASSPASAVARVEQVRVGQGGQQPGRLAGQGRAGRLDPAASASGSPGAAAPPLQHVQDPAARSATSVPFQSFQAAGPVASPSATVSRCSRRRRRRPERRGHPSTTLRSSRSRRVAVSTSSRWWRTSTATSSSSSAPRPMRARARRASSSRRRCGPRPTPCRCRGRSRPGRARRGRRRPRPSWPPARPAPAAWTPRPRRRRGRRRCSGATGRADPAPHRGPLRQQHRPAADVVEQLAGADRLGAAQDGHERRAQRLRPGLQRRPVEGLLQPGQGGRAIWRPVPALAASSRMASSTSACRSAAGSACGRR